LAWRSLKAPAGRHQNVLVDEIERRRLPELGAGGGEDDHHVVVGAEELLRVLDDGGVQIGHPVHPVAERRLRHGLDNVLADLGRPGMYSVLSS